MSRGADEGNGALFGIGEQDILLGFIKTVNFVDKKDRFFLMEVSQTEKPTLVSLIEHVTHIDNPMHPGHILSSHYFSGIIPPMLLKYSANFSPAYLLPL